MKKPIPYYLQASTTGDEHNQSPFGGNSVSNPDNRIHAVLQANPSVTSGSGFPAYSWQQIQWRAGGDFVVDAFGLASAQGWTPPTTCNLTGYAYDTAGRTDLPVSGTYVVEVQSYGNFDESGYEEWYIVPSNASDGETFTGLTAGSYSHVFSVSFANTTFTQPGGAGTALGTIDTAGTGVAAGLITDGGQTIAGAKTFTSEIFATASPYSISSANAIIIGGGVILAGEVLSMTNQGTLDISIVDGAGTDSVGSIGFWPVASAYPGIVKAGASAVLLNPLAFSPAICLTGHAVDEQATQDSINAGLISATPGAAGTSVEMRLGIGGFSDGTVGAVPNFGVMILDAVGPVDIHGTLGPVRCSIWVQDGTGTFQKGQTATDALGNKFTGGVLTTAVTGTPSLNYGT